MGSDPYSFDFQLDDGGDIAKCRGNDAIVVALNNTGNDALTVGTKVVVNLYLGTSRVWDARLLTEQEKREQQQHVDGVHVNGAQ